MPNYRDEIEFARTKSIRPLQTFIKQTLHNKLGPSWQLHIKDKIKPLNDQSGPLELDLLLCLRIIDVFWNEIFSSVFQDKKIRTLANEAITIRNEFAHDRDFTFDDTERALDTFSRLLRAIRAEQPAEELSNRRRSLLAKNLDKDLEQQNAPAPPQAPSNQEEAPMPKRSPIKTHEEQQAKKTENPDAKYRIRITEEQAKSCYDQFLRVHNGEITIDDAAKEPVRLGMNPNSAKRYIAATLKGMMLGETYKSAVNLRDQALFLSFIERDFGKEGLGQALRAYEGHFDYLEKEVGVAHPRRREQLAEFSKRLT